MVNYRSAPLDATFHALADPTRRAILLRLADGPLPVGELAQPFDMSLPAVSKHLRVLSRAGLLAQEKSGRVRHCTLIAGPMRNADQWIRHYRQFWEGQLDALDHFLRNSQPPPELQ